MEFSGAAEVGKLAAIVEPRRNRGIGADLPDVRRDALAQRERHFGWTEKPDQPIEREVRIAGLRDCRQIRQDRRSNAVGHGQQFDFAGLQLRPHDRISRFVELDAPGGEVVGRLDLVAIRDLRQAKAGLAQESCHEKVDGAGGAGPIELARLRARQRDQLGERFHWQVRGHRNDDDRVRHPGDRLQILGLVGEVLVDEGMRGERGRRRGQQHVIVLGGDHRADRNEPIATWAVLNHHRLAPTLGQVVGEQPGSDIDPAAGPERHQELHGALGPGLRRRRRRRDSKRKRGRQDKDATQFIAHWFSPDAL